MGIFVRHRPGRRWIHAPFDVRPAVLVRAGPRCRVPRGPEHARPSSSPTSRTLPQLRLRPPRHAGALSRVRYNCCPVRRLARILFNAFSVLSLLLFFATVALWVRSYWREDLLRWGQAGRPSARSFFFECGSGGGGVMTLVGFS